MKRKQWYVLLCMLALLPGCAGRETGVSESPDAGRTPVCEAEPTDPAPKEEQTPAYAPKEAQPPEAEPSRLTAADRPPALVPEGWRAAVVRYALYDGKDARVPRGYRDLALALPPGWSAGGEPDADGFFESGSFYGPDGIKLFAAYAVGASGDPGAFPENYADGLEPGPGHEDAPREDLAIDGRRAARYVQPAVWMDGAPTKEQVIPTIYRIETGAHVVELAAYPPQSRTGELYPLFEQTLASVAVYDTRPS